MDEESNPQSQPPALSRWRWWVIVLLGVQSLLLALVVLALWPLVSARIAEIREQRPQQVSVMTEEQKFLPIYVSPSLTGETACKPLDPVFSVTAYRVPFTWSWPRLRALLWDREAVEVAVDPSELTIPWKTDCRGFVPRTRLLDAKH